MRDMTPRLVRVPFLPWNKAAAMTLGRRILVKRGVLVSVSLVAHELVHVDQWITYRWTMPFRYVWQWVRAGFRYSRIPMELEAEQFSTSFLYQEWAKRVLVKSGWSFDGR